MVVVKLCKKHAKPEKLAELLGISIEKLVELDVKIQNVGANWDECEYCKKYPKLRGDVSNA